MGVKMAQQHEQDSASLSNVLQNYLEIIFRLEINNGVAKASAIAEEAQVSRSTVTSALKTLKNMNMVEYSPYGPIKLTAKGQRMGKELHHKHVILQDFFQSILQIDGTDASEVACKLEHDMPQSVIWRLGQFLLFLKSRPELWQDWQGAYLKEELARHSHPPVHRMPLDL